MKFSARLWGGSLFWQSSDA